jgi:hypothetical protein
MTSKLNNFQESIRQEIVDALTSAPHNGQKSGQRVDKIVCIHCDQPEAWTHVADPFTVHCNRKNKCQHGSTHVKAYAPALFEDFAKKSPPTKKDPTATATAYLQSRGLNTDLITSQYGQGKIAGFHTVAITPEWSKLAWHRLIGKEGKNKGKWDAGAKYGGKAYTTSNDFSAANEIWIVEGAVNLWTLEQVGFRGAATMGTGNVPTELYESINKSIPIILAFDADRAGEIATAKNKEKLKEIGFGDVKIAMAPDGQDWNDLLTRGALAPERLSTTIADARFRGRLFEAANPKEYMRILYEWRGYGSNEFSRVFSFHYSLYHGSKDNDDFKVEELADARIKAPYKVIAENGDHSLVVVVETPDKAISIDVPAEIMTGTKFHELVLRKTGRLIPDQKQPLRKLFKYLRAGAKAEIRDTDAIGYDSKSRWFLFRHGAYDVSGKVIKPEEGGEYRYRGHRYLRGLPFKDAILEIDEAPLQPSQFVRLVAKAFGGKGMLALGFWVSSTYSTQIFNYYHKFPFLSMYGENKTGKSTFSRILNRAFNFADTEGFGINKSTSVKAIERTLSQFSSMCLPLAEWTDQSKFTEEHTLNLYSRLPLYSIAARTQDKTVLDFPFRCSIAFVMNNDPFSRAETKERVVSMRFRQSDNSAETLSALKQLQRMPKAKLATIGDQLLKNRQNWEATDSNGRAIIVNKTEALCEWMLQQDVNNERVVENHCVPLAAFEMFLELHCKDIPSTERDALLETAKFYALGISRDKAENAITELAEADTMLSIAFELKDDEDAKWVKWNAKTRRLHISLKGYIEDHVKQVQNRTTLKEECKRHRNYVKTDQARVKSGSTRCHIFEFPPDTIIGGQDSADVEPPAQSPPQHMSPPPMAPVEDIDAAVAVYRDVQYTHEGSHLMLSQFRALCIKKYPEVFNIRKFDDFTSNQKFQNRFSVDLKTTLVSIKEDKNKDV